MEKGVWMSFCNLLRQEAHRLPTNPYSSLLSSLIYEPDMAESIQTVSP
jgi:hypothetical protein